MFILFNIGALIQAIIIGFIIAIFSLFIYVFNLEYSFVDYNDYYLIIPVFYFFYAILAFTDRRLGIKGKLFFFSTWFLCLLLILLVNPGLYFRTKDKNIFDHIYFGFNIILPFYLWYKMVKSGLDKFNYEVEGAKIILSHAQYTVTESYREKNTVFWSYILNSSCYPPFMYRNFNGLYKILNRKAIKEDKFADHYINIIEKIEGKANIPSDNTKLVAAKHDLIKFKSNPDLYFLNYDYIKSVIEIILKENKVE